MGCAECTTGQKLTELQMAQNVHLIEAAQVTEEQANARTLATCARSLLAMHNMKNDGIWPEAVESTGCPILDSALYDVEVEHAS